MEAMVACDEFMSELPVEFHALPVAEAIEILAINHVVDSTYYFECKRKQEELTKWIEDE